jgi:hypothetical protein
VRNIAVAMAASAALCATAVSAGTALAMPVGNLAAPSSVIAVQAADYICGPSYGCWMQPNPFYGPFYGPAPVAPQVAAPVPYGYAVRWHGPPPYGRLWYGRSPYDPGWYTGGWRW